MKSECLNYILSMIISDFKSNANEEQIEKYKQLYSDEIKWELGFDKAFKDYAKNKTRTEYIIEEIYKFMKQENLLGEYDLNVKQ